MKLAVTLIIIILCLIYFLVKYLYRYWSSRGIPHDAPIILTGNMTGWRQYKHFVDIFDPVYRKYKGTGPFAGFYFFFKPAIIALDLDFVKNVLIKDFNNFDDRGMFHNERDDPLSGNLFQMSGDIWRPLRQKLTPTFTSGKMKFMFPTVLKVADEFLNVFTEQTCTTKDGLLEVTNLLARFTADVIGTCAFGLECNSLRDPNAEFVVMGKRVLVEKRHNFIIDNLIETFPNLARKLRMRQVLPDADKFYKKIVYDTVRHREKNAIKRNDFMNLLIDLKNSENGLTLNELTAQSFVFFIAGFETSSTTMGFTLYELAKNPDIQNKLRNEINKVFEQHNNVFSYECMKDMHYLEQVIAETLRKYPILPQLIRKSKNHYETTDPKYYIEKDTMVIIPINAIQNDPEIYTEPEKFDPDRFLPEEIQKRHSCSYLPFGDGPRNCIGLRFGKMQASIGLVFLIRNFKFSVCKETPNKIEFVKENVLLSSKNGIKLKVEKC